jgi:hypothetical protein
MQSCMMGAYFTEIQHLPSSSLGLPFTKHHTIFHIPSVILILEWNLPFSLLSFSHDIHLHHPALRFHISLTSCCTKHFLCFRCCRNRSCCSLWILQVMKLFTTAISSNQEDIFCYHLHISSHWSWLCHDRACLQYWCVRVCARVRAFVRLFMGER